MVFGRMDRKITGYTLIELMVVMSIIALLSAISIFALQGARRSSRDTQRKGDLEAIRSALELYKSDCGVYPNDSGGGDFNTLYGGDDVFDTDDGTCTVTGNAREYLTNIPVDPQGVNAYYYHNTSNFEYVLCATLEEPPATPQNCGGAENYRVRNP